MPSCNFYTATAKDVIDIANLLKEYRSFALFNQMMKIIKKQANEKPIHMSISTKLIADSLMKRAGFESMGGIWRMS